MGVQLMLVDHETESVQGSEQPNTSQAVVQCQLSGSTCLFLKCL